MKLTYSCFIILMLFSACHHYQKNNSHKEVPDEAIERGEILAKQYCQTCHQLPDPKMLSPDKWEKGVLPQMGPKLGIFQFGFKFYPSSLRDPNIGSLFYPDKPLLTLADWQHIIDYYTSLAPDSLLASKNDVAIVQSDKLFSPFPAGPHFSYFNPMTGSLYANSSSKEHVLLIADINKKSIVSVNQDFASVDSIELTSPVISMILNQDTLLTANIGVLVPNDEQTGTIQQLYLHKGKFVAKPIMLADSLSRPVHIDIADFNNDGLQDILVCEFGNLKGALSWLENKGNNIYKRHTLREQPGAIATVVKNFNKDSLPDVYVLFAQGDEQIIRFENKGNGKFEQKQLLRFPPVYGSSYFEMNDINKDGFDDIIYTCGDNADYSTELKPYHGVYVFINNGHDEYRQKFFFHLNGCFKAIARDFDNDGDIDIAAISFFADYEKRPEEGFVYLQNNGNYNFAPFSLPATKNGRWLSMDVTDIDSNGKPDIILGNFSAPSFRKSAVDWQKQPAFLLLKNIMP